MRLVTRDQPSERHRSSGAELFKDRSCQKSIPVRNVRLRARLEWQVPNEYLDPATGVNLIVRKLACRAQSGGRGERE